MASETAEPVRVRFFVIGIVNPFTMTGNRNVAC
jgi:hypothetical protein